MNPRRGLAFTLLALVAGPVLGAAEAGTVAAPAADSAAPLADPMRPPVLTPSAPAPAEDGTAPRPSYALSAIKLDGPRSYAIVNGALVRTGDRIDGARVRKIARQSVDITTDSGVVTLRLNSLEIKRHVDSRQHPR